MNNGRLAWLTPEQMTDAQRAVYDTIVDSPRTRSGTRAPITDPAGRLQGPFNAMLLNPEVGDALQVLGTQVRYHSGLDGRAREIAILQVARACRSDYEWQAHARAGRAAGLTGAEIEAIREDGAPDSLSSQEALVWSVVDALLTTRDLADELAERASDELGDAVVMDLSVLVGYYELLAMILRVFRTELPAGVEPVFGDAPVDTAAPAQYALERTDVPLDGTQDDCGEGRAGE